MVFEDGVAGKVGDLYDFLKGYRDVDRVFSYEQAPLPYTALYSEESNVQLWENNKYFIQSVSFLAADAHRMSANPNQEDETIREVETDEDGMIDKFYSANAGGAFVLRRAGDSTEIAFLRALEKEDSGFFPNHLKLEATVAELSRNYSDEEREELLEDFLRNYHEGEYDDDKVLLRVNKNKQEEGWEKRWEKEGQPENHLGQNPWARGETLAPDKEFLDAAERERQVDKGIGKERFSEFFGQLRDTDGFITGSAEMYGNEVSFEGFPGYVDDELDELVDVDDLEFTLITSNTEEGVVYRGHIEEGLDEIGRIEVRTVHDEPITGSEVQDLLEEESEKEAGDV